MKRECCFTAVVGLPTPTVIDGGRTHHVASNMAGTSAPSTTGAFLTTSDSLSECSVEVNHLCLRARYHQNRELRACRDPHERPRNTSNYKMVRQSSELSDVAQTARRTRKHYSSTVVEEQVTFLHSWWRPTYCIDSSCSK